MAGLYDANGNIRLTVHGTVTTFRGLYAADGSWNAYIVSGGGWKGRFAPDGGLNITIRTSQTGYYAADGSVLASLDSGNYIIPRSGYTPVSSSYVTTYHYLGFG